MPRSCVLPAVLSLTLLVVTGAATANPIQRENARTSNATSGGPAPPGRTGGIEGYASQVSVAAGDRLELHVRLDPPARYRVEVVRLGWYAGGGARRMACLPSCRTDRAAAQQPSAPAPNPATGLVDAGWAVTDSIVVPKSWPSGYYVARFVLTTGAAAGTARAYPFVVRSRGRPAPILVIASVNTWQAYNPWGGKSLYTFNSSGGRAAVKVSFNRPYIGLEAYQWEYPLVRFLEREGYDVDYATNVDVQRDPSLMVDRELVLSAGHDEYWTKQIRDAFERARAAGTDLAFMGADIGYWQLRYEDGERTEVLYRSASADPVGDPARKTIRFAELTPPRPPCELMGVQYRSGSLARNGDPPRDYRVVAGADDPWLAGTGLHPGDVLRDTVGYEWDSVIPGCRVPTPTVLFHYDGPRNDADAVRYTAASGARVFSAGSMQLVWALDAFGGTFNGHPGTGADPRVQRFFQNALADLAPHAVPGPEILSFSVAPRVFRTSRGSARRRRSPFGTSFRYVLARPATVRITAHRVVRARRAGRRLLFEGTLVRSAPAGRGVTRFRGRIGGHVLKPGRYVATITVSTPAGTRAVRRRTARFRVVAR